MKQNVFIKPEEQSETSFNSALARKGRIKSNDAISIAKGIGIILMVIGHAGCPSWMFWFIYLFHMPLFFFLSGYCFKEKYLDDKKTFVIHRLKGLYIPFVKYNLLFILFHNLLYSMNILEQPYTWNEALNKSLHIFLMGETEVNLGPYWFLRYLLLSALAFLLIKWLTRKRPQIIRYGFWLIPFIAIPCNYYQFSHILSSIMLLSFFFYCAGYMTKKQPITRNMWIIAGCFIIVAIASIFINAMMARLNTADIIPYCFFALVGVYASFALSNRIASTKTWLKKTLVYVGNHTMVILTWHFLVFQFISLFYLKVILNRPFTSVITEEVHQQLGGLHFLVYTVLGITIPLLLQWLFSVKHIKRWLHIR